MTEERKDPMTLERLTAKVMQYEVASHRLSTPVADRIVAASMAQAYATMVLALQVESVRETLDALASRYGWGDARGDA